MRSAAEYFRMVSEVAEDGISRGLVFLTVENAALDGRTIQLQGRSLVHFDSCSYLGLELDPRLIEGAIDATRRFGTQFSSSRAFLRASLYAEFEGLLEQLFGFPALTTQTTTLAHSTALPVIIEEKDAAILDQRTHHSVHQAMNHVCLQGTAVETLRHDRLDLLAERIEALREKHRRIWYLADGVYSMGGELAPLNQLADLLDRYEQLHVYIDDAHGMSWTGRHGRGYALALDHPRTTVVTSFAKGFGVGGAAILIRDPIVRRRVATTGHAIIFSGPMQPPLLGGCIASAKIHLLPEIEQRQAALLERIRLCNRLLLERNLPLLSAAETPIRCIGIGTPHRAYRVVELLVREGFHVTAAVFPALPLSRSGVRIALTTHHTLADIERFVDVLAGAVHQVMREDGYSVEQVRNGLKQGNIWMGAAASTSALTLQRAASIDELQCPEWDTLLGNRGAFTVEGLRTLEQAFGGNPQKENNWSFQYYVVRDRQGRPVLASFFTDALWKDDMLASAEVSRRIELVRATDPFYLTSRTLSMGALLTEGEHLFLDRNADWKRAMLLLLEALGAEKAKSHLGNLVLRDLPDDPELDAFLKEQGFLRFALPPSTALEVTWKNDEEWLASLSRRGRKHQQEQVLPFEDRYDVSILSHGHRLSLQERTQLYRLYLNVKERGFEINTFALPERFFDFLLEHPCWEILALRLKPEHGGDGQPVAMGVIFKGKGYCATLVAGLSYENVKLHHAYRILLLKTLRRCQALGARQVHLGYTAELEKQRFGAKSVQRWVYVLSSDTYHSEILAQMRVDLANRKPAE